MPIFIQVMYMPPPVYYNIIKTLVLRSISVAGSSPPWNNLSDFRNELLEVKVL